MKRWKTFPIPLSEINEDKKKLAELKTERLKEMSKEEKENLIRGKIAELLLRELIENEWIYKDFYFTETSEFDDWINKVDCVMEFEGNPQKAAVIDFSTAKEEKVIGKKIEKIKERIEKETLFEVKYFKSQQDGKKYFLKELPGFIIGIGPNTLEELINLYQKGKEKK